MSYSLALLGLKALGVIFAEGCLCIHSEQSSVLKTTITVSQHLSQSKQSNNQFTTLILILKLSVTP